MSTIRNAASLSRTEERRTLVSCIEAAYDAINTERVLRSSVSVDGTTLTISSVESGVTATYDLAAYKRVFIVGCGKIACEAAAILENILGARVTAGAVVGLSSNVCEIVTTYKGTHPLPTQANFTASAHIKNIARAVTAHDLVIAIIGGGGSAMLCSTEGECDQGQRLYESFLKTGGTIDELNIVRRHISPLKGGGLAKIFHPATIVGLIFSDIPGGNPETVASGPTYKDTTTARDAQAIIEHYALGEFELNETPKDEQYFERVTNILLVSNISALAAVEKKVGELGFEAIVPECDPYSAPTELVSCMRQTARPRSIVYTGAEPRIKVGRVHGTGGRCSTTALAALPVLEKNQTFAAVASDGRDNGDAAGALVDVASLESLKRRGIDIDVYRVANDASMPLDEIGDLIMTGPLESNVSDFYFLLTI